MRAFTEEDRDLADGHDDPDYVLELRDEPAGAEALRLGFWKSQEGLAAFRSKHLVELSHKRYVGATFAAQADSVRRDRLREIMRAGHDLLGEALGDDGLARLNAALGRLKDGAPLRVDNDLAGAGLLWGMLHPGPVPSESNVQPSGLLGYRFPLVWPLDGRDTALAPEDAAINVFLDGRGKRYGFVDDPSLASVQRKTERRLLAGHGGAGFEPLHDIPLDGEGEDEAGPGLEDEAELVAYLTLHARLLTHFACHGGSGSKGSGNGKYTLTVRRKRAVAAGSLRQALVRHGRRTLDAASGAGSSFLFLNLCGSALDHPIPGRDAASALSGLRPEALVGTMGAVCDSTAEETARRFYEAAFRSDRTVADAYLHAIRRGLTETLNPAHLLFVLKGRPDVVIA
ncbi:MAG TPA: hypothetical protein VF559_04600 [Caulobacteraceae bacterium]